MSKEQLYFSGDNAFTAYASQDKEEIVPIQRGIANSYDRSFVGYDTNISVKSEYHRGDFERFRASQAMPQSVEDMMRMADEAYQKVGIVRKIIDLMGDFGSQGIRLQHPVTRVQNFYNSWFLKVNGAERSERFLNNLYRIGNVVVRRDTGKITVGDQRDWQRGKADDGLKLQKNKTNKRDIPLRYTFLNPINLHVVGGQFTPFGAEPVLAYKVSTSIKSILSAPYNSQKPDLDKILEQVPLDIREQVKKGAKYIPLDQTKLERYYYKRDDWQIWARPMTRAIFNDLVMLDKMKLADLSALDGAISSVRLWKLGIIGDNPQNSILPTKTAINKLRNILANNVGGGVLDLVWGPELTFEESASQVWRWLGSEKYDNTINAIYEGLGVPPSLRMGNSSTNTGNYVGLNVFMKQLKYGRDALIKFWKKEVKLVHEAMDFPGRPPEVIFDYMTLVDEVAEKQILLNMWDRNIIPTETILDVLGRIPGVEKAKVNKEYNEMDKGSSPPKASPFHPGAPKHDLRKIALQGGTVTPSQVGLELEPNAEGEMNKVEQMDKLKQASLPKDNTGTPGRPSNIKETEKRQPKVSEKPSSRAEIMLWAAKAQKQITEILKPGLLSALGKSSLRELTKKEFGQVEYINFSILSNLKPLEEFTSSQIIEMINCQPPQHLRAIVKYLPEDLSILEQRQFYLSAYIIGE
jgi:hypothetical protein